MIVVAKCLLLNSPAVVRLWFIHFFSRNEDSPVKRGPGRPRKRKNCSNSKSNTNNELDVSAVNSPAAEQMEMQTSSPEADPGDNVDEEEEAGDVVDETDPDRMCGDNHGQEEDMQVVVEETLQVIFVPMSDSQKNIS